METPTTEQIKEAREKAGLSQRLAAETCYVKPITWQHWEYGINPMPVGLWELFLLKNSLIKI